MTQEWKRRKEGRWEERRWEEDAGHDTQVGSERRTQAKKKEQLKEQLVLLIEEGEKIKKWKERRKFLQRCVDDHRERPVVPFQPPLELTVRVNPSAHWGRRRSPGTLYHERGGRSAAAHRGRPIRVTCC